MFQTRAGRPTPKRAASSAHRLPWYIHPCTTSGRAAAEIRNSRAQPRAMPPSSGTMQVKRVDRYPERLDTVPHGSSVAK